MALSFTLTAASAPTRKAGRKVEAPALNSEFAELIRKALGEFAKSDNTHFAANGDIDAPIKLDGENPFDTVKALRAWCKAQNIAFGKPRDAANGTIYIHGCARDASGKAVTVKGSKAKAVGFTFYISRVTVAD